MKKCLLIIIFIFMVFSPPLLGASEVEELFNKNACNDARVVDAVDPQAAYEKAGLLLNEGKKELGDLYMACAIYRGGGAYLYNAGLSYQLRGDPRALDYFLAASALGIDDAEREAGKILLKEAKTERERLVALAFLSSSLKGCRGAAKLDYRDEALRTKSPIALMEAYAWTKVSLSRNQGPDVHPTFPRWLNEYSQLMTDGMLELAEKRASIVIDRQLDCSDRRNR
ncbi:hypothetical protein DFR29_10575 [Tahibacter aquaticus]|uniref:Sel1 repeat-containing protein n=1 Tax=Tahibacter aquaticus TaxID=520092 RepID=A0A4R6Z078_9GAMM|nr:hypothetical protein [Tahibacter aquaticus]TDR44892.1 hypothetical protein DFR29_10575 [Tahibacter aquaticus]